MARYRSVWDPYDVDRKQPHEEFDVGNIRIRLFANHSWRGTVWKFDVHQVKERKNGEEFFRGIDWSRRNLQDLLEVTQLALARCAPAEGVNPTERPKRLPPGYGKDDLPKNRK